MSECPQCKETLDMGDLTTTCDRCQDVNSCVACGLYTESDVAIVGTDEHNALPPEVAAEVLKQPSFTCVRCMVEIEKKFIKGLAQNQLPSYINHIWHTDAAEKFYKRKLAGK